MEKYIEMKESICKNQTLDDVIVLNYEDQYLREFGEKVTNTKVVWFSSARELEEGYYLDGKDIVYKHEGVKKVLVNVDELNIIGKHNYENVMAACAMAVAMEVPFDKLHEALTEFVAVEHRIEYTCTKKGVKYYNDSKGTNPDAAIQAIRAMQSPTYLIGGGYDKGSEFDEWINAFDGKVKKLVLIGVTAKKIAETCDRLGFKDYVFMDTFEEAVNYCAEHAVSGENVLLSPACASWDMFKSYEERGRIFKELARKLPD
jgi:UDP-N-acetylmuramoylalanine--D-glutamate ligase